MDNLLHPKNPTQFLPESPITASIIFPGEAATFLSFLAYRRYSMLKPRYIVLTDIFVGFEVDDIQSMICLLLYSTK